MTLDEVVPYLMERGLITSKELVCGRAVVEDKSRRNRNFRYQCNPGHQFFIKESDSADIRARASIGAEAKQYRALEACFTGKAQNARFTPQLHLYDPERSIVIMEWVESSVSGAQYLDSYLSSTCRKFAYRLGYTVAQYQMVESFYPGETLGAPWALRFMFPSIDLLSRVSQGQLAVIRYVQRDAEALSSAAAAARNYRNQVLVHGDLRPDNILVRQLPGSNRFSLFVIDWELSGCGDPAWDIGSAIAALLVRCIRWITPRSQLSLASVTAAFQRRLPICQAEINSLLNGYCRAAADRIDNRDDYIRRASLYAGARLLQYAFEWSVEDCLTVISACFLQMGINILRDPTLAVREVFGLGSTSRS